MLITKPVRKQGPRKTPKPKMIGFRQAEFIAKVAEQNALFFDGALQMLHTSAAHGYKKLPKRYRKLVNNKGRRYRKHKKS